VIGIGIGAAFALGGHAPKPVSTPAIEPAMTMTMPVVEAPVVHPPAPPVAPVAAPEIQVEPPPAPVVKQTHHPRSTKHLTNPVATGSNAEVTPPPTLPEPPVVVEKAHVEWKPTMLLPTDSGKTKK
ncbi:MAG TPA: hypothetical protein VGC41_18550, partial [Kofleriaceae bacterium]